MVDKVDGSQANVAAQVAEQQRLEELEQAQRERLLADAAIEKALEVAQAEQAAPTTSGGGGKQVAQVEQAAPGGKQVPQVEVS